ncbi:MAG: MBL fold metallo-hydrolase [Sandaracinaceae bacterium]
MRVAVLRSVRISNTWLLADDEGRRFLIDTGHPLERPALAAELWRAGVRRRGDLSAVLLTHRHSDHAGNAAWLRERFSCPVVAHPADAAILEDRTERPALAGRGAPHFHEVLCRVEDRFPARTVVDETLDDGETRFGFRAASVAGHTEGSVLLFHEATGALFSGDAILAGVPVQRLVTHLRFAVPEYSFDAEACARRARAFLASDPPVRTLCAGHGPMLRDAKRALGRLRSRR